MEDNRDKALESRKNSSNNHAPKAIGVLPSPRLRRVRQLFRILGSWVSFSCENVCGKKLIRRLLGKYLQNSFATTLTYGYELLYYSALLSFFYHIILFYSKMQFSKKNIFNGSFSHPSITIVNAGETVCRERHQMEKSNRDIFRVWG